MKEFEPRGSELIDLPISSEQEPKLDAIVVLGKNIGVNWTKDTVRQQRFHLSPHTRISVSGAGIAYEAGFSDRIIFSTGKTAGKDIPSEAQLMKDHLKRIFHHIPDEAIILEENSKNTDTNAEEVKRIIDRFGFEQIGLMTVGFHMPRAEFLFKLHGISPMPLPSEEILWMRRKKFVQDYLNSPLVQKEIKKEETALKIQSNALGRLALRTVTRITRG